MSANLLQGKAIVVTGASSGIGAAIVKAAAAEGANVVLNHLDDQANAVDVVTAAPGPGQAVAVDADVSNADALTSLVTAAVTQFGRLDVWINNAGVETGSTLLETSEQEYDAALAVNLRAVFFATQAAARQFVRQDSAGLIVNITSVHEDWPMPGNAAYCVAKGGVRMLTRNAGVELAEHGIRVVNVAPGAVDTPINAATTDDPEALRALLDRIPLRRLAQPEDIAQVVVSVCSNAHGNYLNATTVFVDGGMMQRGSDL